MADNPESGFLIGGTYYPVPTLDTFTMDEAVILYEYSGLTLEDFATPDPDDDDQDGGERAKRMRNPGLIQALIHIAYARGNPQLKKQKVRQVIGQANLIETLEALMGDSEDEDDASPPPVESTSEPNGSFPRSSDGSNGSSGSVSEIGLVERDEIPPTTGLTRSDISPIFGQETSVA